MLSLLTALTGDKATARLLGRVLLYGGIALLVWYGYTKVSGSLADSREKVDRRPSLTDEERAALPRGEFFYVDLARDLHDVLDGWADFPSRKADTVGRLADLDDREIRWVAYLYERNHTEFERSLYSDIDDEIIGTSGPRLALLRARLRRIEAEGNPA